MKSVERNVSPASEYYLFSPSKTAQVLFFYPLRCGSFIYEPGYSLERSALDSFLLMYIQKGTMRLDFGGRQQTVPEKHFVLIDCYEPHGYSTVEGYECLWLHFDGPLARGYYQQIISRLGLVFALENAFPVLQRMNAILNIFQENRQLREPLFSKYITDILTELLLDPPSAPSTQKNTAVAEKAMMYISEHFMEPVSVADLARICSMSPYHLIRVFRQETGYTPHEYIVSRRMASARYLLRYTELSIKEICFSTGFSGESVFCQAFRKHNQMTPHEYRLQGLAGTDPSGKS